MNTLTYEALKPHLNEENCVWEENRYATCPDGHEDTPKAWKRLFRENLPPKQDAIASFDLHDSGCFVFTCGRVVMWTYYGAAIYQLPDKVKDQFDLFQKPPTPNTPVMNESTTLPYPDHTPPTPPEGMKWKYRGLGWRDDRYVNYYFIERSGLVGHAKGQSQGIGSTHYFEAVPILKDSGFEFGKTTLKDVLTSENLKEAEGRKKCPMQLLPPEFLTQTANVLGGGAEKYSPWNWRFTKIRVTTYIGAISRHLASIAEGEDIDESGFPHLAHIAASCAILLDAGKHDCLEDDRINKIVKNQKA